MNFYRDCAKVIDQLDAKKGSIHSSLQAVHEKQRKRAAAVVIETLKYRQNLQETIASSKLLVDEKRLLTPTLAALLVHDLLLSKTGLQLSDGPVKQAIMRHKTRLQAEWVKLKIRKGAKSDAAMAQQDASVSSMPRYVRVNALKWTLEDAMEYFLQQGYSVEDSDEPLTRKTFRLDSHIPNLLHFSNETSLQTLSVYKDGRIILQDKASCFPSFVLSPPPRAVVMDGASAPGNKTTHLSALMQNTGQIYAFERDSRRFKTLEIMVDRAGCTNVTPVLGDFLETDPADPKFLAVTHILLDPSCSGSGIVNRLDYLLDIEQDELQDERLHKLSAFQLRMIEHAMKFPAVEKVVYSTCSIHAEENELVVSAALKSSNGRFSLAAEEHVIPSWQRRGLQEHSDKLDPRSLIRCSPADRTNGFFVSCFVRVTQPFPVNLLLDKRPRQGQKRRIDQIRATGTKKKRVRKRTKVVDTASEDVVEEEWMGVA